MPVAILLGILWIGALIVAPRYLRAPVIAAAPRLNVTRRYGHSLIYLGLIVGALATGSF